MGAAVAVVLPGRVGHGTSLGEVVSVDGVVVFTGSGWVTLKVQLQWHTGGGGGLVDVGLGVVVVGTVGQVTGGVVGGGAGHSVRVGLCS
jgi:hypothetical protein